MNPISKPSLCPFCESSWFSSIRFLFPTSLEIAPIASGKQCKWISTYSACWGKSPQSPCERTVNSCGCALLRSAYSYGKMQNIERLSKRFLKRKVNLPFQCERLFLHNAPPDSYNAYTVPRSARDSPCARACACRRSEGSPYCA